MSSFVLERRSSILAFALLLGIAAVPSSTSAQSTAGGEDARAIFQLGERAYRLGHYDEAIASWDRAYALDARPRIQYNLAQAYERLGRLAEAVHALAIFVDGTSADDPLRAEATARLASLRQRLGATGIRIAGGEDGSRILVDGEPWGSLPRPDPIPVDPGSHRLAIERADGSRYDVAITVQGGQVVEVAVPISLAEPPPRGAHHRGHAWTFAGAGVAATGAALLGYGIARQAALSGCSDPGYVCLEESAVSRQRTVGFALGAGLLAAGGAMIVVDLVRARPEDHASVRLGLGVASLSMEVRR